MYSMSDFPINTQYFSLLTGKEVSWTPLIFGTTFSVFSSEKWIAKVNTSSTPRLQAHLEISHRCTNFPFIPRLIAYDDHALTPYEICILQKLPGENWAKILLSQTREEIISLWEEMMSAARLFWQNSQSPSQMTFADHLQQTTTKRILWLKTQHSDWSDHLDLIEAFVKKHANLFETSPCGFVHPDLHPGNILCMQGHLTGVVDLDEIYEGPQEGYLPTLLSFLERPGMFIPSTVADFSQTTFPFLYPSIKKAYADIWDLPVLIRKLNLLFISQSLQWMTERLSSAESLEFLQVILQRELPKNDNAYAQTYFARLLKQEEKI